ncbi:bis(5'-adenosyl)-triphosphatase enpp4-like [Littorina saxatilis]|uniref:bis(5'-adenosyl)-triphosphatase enpp4-like n=1 Tax=Littorina saxatilis TaxID=31220 RepID=UPI0038B423E1
MQTSHTMGNTQLASVMGTRLVHLVLMLTLLTSALYSLPFAAAADSTSLPKLLLISFDGFGWNYFSKLPWSKLPNFQAFINKGVQVRWVENVFPTVTRPNHMSMVSGLYVESHGIVANEFYDPALKATIPDEGSLQENDSAWVDVGAEPIWITNSKAGQGRRSGTMYWPCSDAKIKNRLPEKMKRGGWNVTEEEKTPKQRIDWVFDWLTQETEPVNFAAVYFGEPDEISHKHGPDSQEVLDAIVSRDVIVGQILRKIKEKKLEEKLNVIITADHGHAPIYRQTMINIDLLIEPPWYTSYQSMRFGTPMIMLFPKGDSYEKIVTGLKDRINLHVETSSNSPDLLDLHYSLNRRIAPIVLYAEPGWVIGTNNTNFTDGNGNHGWDPRYAPLMYPFFIAMGPAFKKGVRNAEPFHIVDIYPLMCHILGLTPAPNNGSLDNTAHILSSRPSDQSHTSGYHLTGVAIGLLVLILAVVIIVVIIRYVRKNNRNVTAAYKRPYTKAGSVEDLMTDGMVVLSDEEL